MNNKNKNEYESRLLGSGDAEYEIKDDETAEEEEAGEYYDLPPAIRSRTRIWSVASIVLAILSVLLCRVYYLGIVLALASIGGAVISRKTLGFFERTSVWGIIFGTAGFVFSIFMLIAKTVGLF